MAVRLAFTVGQLGIGGGEAQLYALLRHVDRARFDPVVVTLHPDANDYFEAPIRELGIPVRGVARSRNKPRRIVHLARLLEDERVSVVHGWGDFEVNPAVALAGRMAGVPVRIGSVRCDLFRDGRGPVDRRLAATGLDLYVANSTRGRAQLLRLGVPDHKIAVVFNGIDVARCDAKRAERDVLRGSWGVPRAACLVAVLAGLRPVKNQQLVLRALEIAARSVADLHVVLIGDGPDRCALEHLAAELGIAERVHMPGQVPDAASVLHAADVLALASLTEGMPNALLAGGAAGLPLVASDVGGARDIITDGVHGRVLPGGDAGALANVLVEWAARPDERRRLGRAARRRVRDDFSAEAMAANLGRVWERLVGARR